MGQNPQQTTGQPRDGRAKVSPAIYRRRRAVVLAAGVGVLTGLGWLVNGMLTASSTAGQAVPPGGAGTAGSAPPHISADPAPSSPSPSPRASSAPSRHRHAGQHASRRTPACPSGGVTLSVSSPQYWYQPGKAPRFTVHAVSSASRPCRFNMGTKFVSVVIASGNRRLWSSADCASGARSDPTVLSSGTPAVLRASWDRRTSSPGCDGAQRLVRPGEYEAEAVAGHLHSGTVHVVLGAKGASGP